MMRGIAKLWNHRRGATAAEFALVLPLLLFFLLGIIDVGRLMWTWNQAEKATQMGVRYAVVTNMVPADLAGYSFSVNGGILQGQAVPITSFGGASCDNTTCTCKGTCAVLGYDAPTFTQVYNRMRLFLPELQPANVVVDYDNVGLGFAGDPAGPDVAPLITVRLRNMTFQPLLLMLFGGSITLPDFRAALTLEDGAGTVSN